MVRLLVTFRTAFPYPAEASSKRGYNARKRSEAAQIAAQNGQFPVVWIGERAHLHVAQLMPTVSYTSTSADRGAEKAGEGWFLMTFHHHLI